MDEYYKVFELHLGASIEEIEAAHRRLQMMWHPDQYFHRNPELARFAQERLKVINDAHDKIIDYLRTGQRPRTSSKDSSAKSRNESSAYATDSDRAAKAAEEKVREARAQAAKERARERAEQERVIREKGAQERSEKDRIEQVKLSQKKVTSIAIRQAIKSIKYAVTIYPIVGFGGCVVRQYTSMDDFVTKDEAWFFGGFVSYRKEAIFASLLIITIGMVVAILTKVSPPDK